MTKDEPRRRTRRFALDVICLVESLPRTRIAEVIGRQLLRSATAVRANYRAATADGRTVRPFNPVARQERTLFEVLMSGEHKLRGRVLSSRQDPTDEMTAP